MEIQKDWISDAFFQTIGRLEHLSKNHYFS